MGAREFQPLAGQNLLYYCYCFLSKKVQKRCFLFLVLRKADFTLETKFCKSGSCLPMVLISKFNLWTQHCTTTMWTDIRLLKMLKDFTIYLAESDTSATTLSNSISNFFSLSKTALEQVLESTVSKIWTSPNEEFCRTCGSDYFEDDDKNTFFAFVCGFVTINRNLLTL